MLLFGLSDPQFLFMAVFAIGLGMTVHEFAHNYVGHLMGDPVPAREGRLTLNPMVHINPVGWLMLAIIGFGVLGSAPISPYRMRDPRWGFFYAVAAGPFSNLLIAVLFAIPYRLLGGTLPDTLVTLLFVTVLFNVLLFVFNLLPLFPIDGWHMVLSLLPPELAHTWQKYQMQSYYAFMGLIFISIAIGMLGIPLPIDPLGLIVFEPVRALTGMLLGVNL